MRNNKSGPIQSKKASLYSKNSLGKLAFSNNSEIRLGIQIADEKAKEEFIKRKIDAPLSTEEKIFLDKK